MTLILHISEEVYIIRPDAKISSFENMNTAGHGLYITGSKRQGQERLRNRLVAGRTSE